MNLKYFIINLKYYWEALCAVVADTYSVGVSRLRILHYCIYMLYIILMLIIYYYIFITQKILRDIYFQNYLQITENIENAILHYYNIKTINRSPARRPGERGSQAQDQCKIEYNNNKRVNMKIKIQHLLLIFIYIITLIYSLINITMMKYEDIELYKMLNNHSKIVNSK